MGVKVKKILFLHGLESTPGGTKPQYLKKHGYKVLNPGLPKSSFEESVRIAQKAVDEEEPDVIVGSSRGGAVALCLEPRGAKLVLIAPAWKRFDRTRETASLKSECVILHSENDNIVNIEDSLQLIEATSATLIKVGLDHRMSDRDALEGMLDAVKWVAQ